MVVLLIFWNKSIVQKFWSRSQKVYAARSNPETELHIIYKDMLHCINSQSRVKIERLETKCNEAFRIVVVKNEDLIEFAGYTEDPSSLFPSLESYLELMTTKNDKMPTSAQNYINSAEDKWVSVRNGGLPFVLESLHWWHRQKHLEKVDLIR